MRSRVGSGITVFNASSIGNSLPSIGKYIAVQLLNSDMGSGLGFGVG